MIGSVLRACSNVGTRFIEPQLTHSGSRLPISITAAMPSF
jgi:hypothetical protein